MVFASGWSSTTIKLPITVRMVSHLCLSLRGVKRTNASCKIYLIKRGGAWESTERFSKPQNGNNIYELEVTIIHSSYLTLLKLHHIDESHLHSVCSLLFMLIRCQHYVRMVAGRLELSCRQNYRYYRIGQRIKYAYIYNNGSRGLAQIDFTAQQLSGVSLLIKHS